MVSISYKPTVKATGKTASKTYIDGQTWTVKNGKIVNGKISLMESVEFDSLFDTDDAMATVGAAFAAWGAGETSKIPGIFAENCAVDFGSGQGLKNTDMMRVWSGHAEITEWWGRMEEIDFAGVCTGCPSLPRLSSRHHPSETPAREIEPPVCCDETSVVTPSIFLWRVRVGCAHPSDP